MYSSRPFFLKLPLDSFSLSKTAFQENKGVIAIVSADSKIASRNERDTVSQAY